jgi:hypothetical protein
VSLSEGSTATAEKILESGKSASNNQDNGQMTVAKRTQTLALNSEIPKPITEAKSKDRERNCDENDKLLCERNKKLDPRGINPRVGKMLINPLRTAY